jgi:predicted metal-dependent phosphoesterase TrpH
MKIDLHTHSVSSADSGITIENYINILESGRLDLIAITDHNHIDTAFKLKKLFPGKIVIGEEILTNEGEIIGLYLNSIITPNRSLKDTVADIRSQKGLVYIPHPLEKIRKGLSMVSLEKIKDSIDILETGNGRALNKSNKNKLDIWAKNNHIVTFASSDAHGINGLGRTYTESDISTNNYLSLMESLKNSKLIITYPRFKEIFYPKYNKYIKKYV